jgi:hypothetical protein
MDRGDPGTGFGSPRYPGTFLAAFGEAATALGWQISRWLGDSVLCLNPDGHEHRVGLDNLYRRARQVERADWSDLVTDFLSHLAVVPGDIDLNESADSLLVRVCAPLARTVGVPVVWAQPLGETGLVLSLVLDDPETVTYITEDMVAASGQPGEHWLERARTNLRARTPDECLEVVEDETGIRLCNVGDAYDAARSLFAEELCPGGAPHGCFLAVPNRDQMLVLPVSADALAHVHLLKVLAEREHASAPYPVSAEVLWVRGGAWHRFPVEVCEEEITLRPPAEFLPVLEQLAPERAGWEAGPDGTES